MNITTAGIPKKGLPEGFSYLDDMIEDAIINARYAGTENIFGRPLKGYNKPLIVVSNELGEGLRRAADILRPQGYVLKVFDAYRPQCAVDDICVWIQDFEDQRRRPFQYPDVPKEEMVARNYIAPRSFHSRGSAVDLTLVDRRTWQELDMGSCFDFLGEISHPGYPLLMPHQQKNRDILNKAMFEAGFEPVDSEWWHFNLKNEPYPDTYFTFPIE